MVDSEGAHIGPQGLGQVVEIGILLTAVPQEASLHLDLQQSVGRRAEELPNFNPKPPTLDPNP